MNTFFNDLYVAVHKPTGRLCLVKYNILSSHVMFQEGKVFLTCEIGPISDFEMIELFERGA